MSKLNGKVISDLLKRVHLGGLINECLLQIKDGKASIQAIDVTNSVAISCQSDIESDDLELGLNNLSMLYKFLGNSEEITYIIKDEKLSLVKPNKERINILMLENESVPTIPPKELDKEKLMEDCKTSFECPDTFLEKLSEYSSMLSVTSVKIKATGKSVILVSDNIKERGFTVPKVAECKEVDESCSSEIMVDHLIAVLKVTDSPVIHIGNDCPLVIEENDNFWALIPIIS